MKRVNVKNFQMIIGVICMSAAGLATANPKPGSEVLGHIKGTLIDSKTLQPLMAANIFIEDTDMACVTDSTGTYCIRNLRPGIYNVRCMSMGYKMRLIINVIVNPGRTTWHKVKVDPVQQIYACRENNH